jgi:predicted RNA-binding protein YlxR (DUF448 family)
LLARIDTEERGSERTCVVTGEKGSPETMLRFALSPDGVVTPDIRRKLPGRGVWTRLDRDTVARAAAKGGFARGFRKPVQARPELAAEVDALLAADALQFLALVNKSGLVVAGFAKVESAVKAGRVCALIHASEGASDGIEKLDRLARSSGRSVATINLFESSQLDLALGRSNVIHAALHAGPASAAFLAKFARLTAYRSGQSVGTLSTVSDSTG